MKCDEVQAILNSYLDGEEQSQQNAIEQHLARCEICRRELNEIKEARLVISQALQGLAADVHTPAHMWDRVQAGLAGEELPSKKQQKGWHPWQAPLWSHLTMNNKGVYNMRKFGFAVLTLIGIVVALYSVLTHHVTTVSAQQILERAAAVDAEMDNTQGIWHVRIKNYQNPLAFEGGAGSTTIYEDYYDYVHGYYRSTSEDAAGNLLHATSIDRQYSYYTQQNGDGPIEPPVVVYRSPFEKKPDQGDSNGDNSTARQLNFDPAANRKAIYEQFTSSPRVRLEGKVSREDGREAYVLVGDNYQTYKRGDGKEEHVLTGSMKMVFDAETYQYLESELKVRVDGEDIILNSVQYLGDEILPLDTQVAWDLSDLPDVTYEDEPEETQPETVTVTASRRELSRHGNFYAPADLPEGYTEDIVIFNTQNADENTFGYEVTYHDENNRFIDLLWIGNDVEDEFIESNFYDGSFKTARGLELHYSISGQEDGENTTTSAILKTPEHISYLLYSDLPRKDVQEFVETLVLLP